MSTKPPSPSDPRHLSEVLGLSAIAARHRQAHRGLRVLEDVSLSLAGGEMVAVTGARHSGKTTLLEIAAGVRPPDRGEVYFDGDDIWQISATEREQLLAARLLWASHESHPVGLAVCDEIAAPIAAERHCSHREARDLAMRALDHVDALDCATRRWEQLSGWERLLVTLARVTMLRPRLLVADDLLDGIGMHATRKAGDLLRSIASEQRCAVLLSASTTEATLNADRIYAIRSGHLRALSNESSPNVGVVDLNAHRIKHGRQGIR